jgi:hypothetical protein
VAEALSWRKTPWGHHQRSKGLETDCAGMVAQGYENAGEIPHVELPWYPQDVMLHRGEEIYFDELKPYFHPVIEPLPGDLAMFRWGRMEGAQGCIIIKWPSVIGAIYQWRKVEIVDATDTELRGRLSGFWSTI